MNKLIFLSELLLRIKTEKPSFFKKLQIISGSLALICLSIIGYDYLICEIENEKILSIANTLFWFLGGVAITGQLPTKDKANDI